MIVMKKGNLGIDPFYDYVTNPGVPELAHAKNEACPLFILVFCGTRPTRGGLVETLEYLPNPDAPSWIG